MKNVKRVVFCLVLFLGFFMLFSCGTRLPTSEPIPAPEPEPEPVVMPLPPPPPKSPERAHDLVLDGAEFYTVERRDTLSRIARIKYGSHNGFYYPLIIMASRDIVDNQDRIERGILLTIPNLQANLDDARARASMKKFFLVVADITGREYKRPRDAAGLRRLAESL